MLASAATFSVAPATCRRPVPLTDAPAWNVKVPPVRLKVPPVSANAALLLPPAVAVMAPAWISTPPVLLRAMAMVALPGLPPVPADLRSVPVLTSVDSAHALAVVDRHVALQVERAGIAEGGAEPVLTFPVPDQVAVPALTSVRVVRTLVLKPPMASVPPAATVVVPVPVIVPPVQLARRPQSAPRRRQACRQRGSGR